MKRVFIALLTAVFCLASMLPAPARAVVNRVLCQPGDTFYAVFALAEDGDRPDGVLCRPVYDTDIFTLVPGVDLVGADGFNILSKHPAILLFKVNKYAPAGEYSIQAAVIEAYDADGRKYTNAKIAPVQVTVESASAAAPEQTPAPAPASEPLPSAAGTGKKQIQAGDYVTFGHYPQTAAGNDMTPIEWLVLEVKGNKALLLSKYGLDAKPYNTVRKDVTWENCTLRNWLNKEFMKKAFSSKEREAILMTAVDNSRNQGYSGYAADGGNNTVDKVFLLSCAEATKYLSVHHSSIFGSKNNMDSRVSPTEYAKASGAIVNGLPADGVGLWWLRSPGAQQFTAANVLSDGSFDHRSVRCDYEMVRPALWVNLDAISQ